MSDLSLPPLTLEPLPLRDEAPADLPEQSRAEPFAWPSPPFASYPAPVCQIGAEPCEIEGLNGSVMKARLTNFDPVAGLAQIQTPPARTTMPLRFAQFRRLALSTPLEPLVTLAAAAGAAATAQDETLASRPAVPYRVRLKTGPDAEGQTVGHVDNEIGVFLFEPLNARGAVRRVFIPRRAVEQLDIGTRLGDMLVAQNAVSQAQVEQTAREQQDLRNQRVGDILVVRNVVTPEQLEAAIEQQARMPMVRMGEALIALGFIDEQQLEEALVQQRSDRSVPLGELLVRKGLISRNDLQTALARKMGYPIVDVTKFPVEAEALGRVTFAVANRLQALPLLLRNGRLIAAVEDPSRAKAIDELEFAAGCKVVPVLARTGSVGAAIDSAYQKLGAEVWQPVALDGSDTENADSSKLLATLEQHSEGRSEDEKIIEQSDNSLVRLINSMIQEAQAQGVSDIHIESQPNKDKVRIRFRRDGVLKPYLELPYTYRSAMIARIKIMCDLDISERRKPQDGKITLSRWVAGSRLELRVATIPTQGGLEDAVLRLLASARPMPLDDIGLAPRNLALVKTIVQRPYGMFLCVGPTGSGKTTTLHSAMGYINVPERKIWTAEDPVEITQPGLRQVQVNPKIDWTFAKALRAFLRADPDVIMVGEIRDKETAQMAIESSLTGHLVLSTLHTNSAPETVTRLLDMGMDPFNFADSLLGVLAQRLVRRLCMHCRVTRAATPEEVDELLQDWMHGFSSPAQRPKEGDVLAGWQERFGRDGKLVHHHSPGCEKCHDTGFRGRAGLHELMTVSRPVRHLIQTGARAEEMQQAALAEGMRTLRQDGIEKVIAGITTIGEVRATSNG
jgi:type II secretory ATPase GspE/PulE/Tfp pilus assembly ATPase PilB-like protein